MIQNSPEPSAPLCAGDPPTASLSTTGLHPWIDAGLRPGRTISLRDARMIFRLVNEVRSLGADPREWRPYMVGALRLLLRAHIVVSSEIHFRRVPSQRALRVIDIGWICDGEGQVSQILTERDDERPEAFWLTAGERGGEAEESTDDSSPPLDSGDDLVPVKPTRAIYGGTSFILSQVTLPHIGAVDQLGLHREFGDEPFTHAEHRLARVFHVELGRLWKEDVLRQAGMPQNALPPRLSQTLRELESGSSEKQVARKLALSQHTIHNYVKALHQRLGVNSRGELLAKAREMDAETAPHLAFSLSTLPARGGRRRGKKGATGAAGAASSARSGSR